MNCRLLQVVGLSLALALAPAIASDAKGGSTTSTTSSSTSSSRGSSGASLSKPSITTQRSASDPKPAGAAPAQTQNGLTKPTLNRETAPDEPKPATAQTQNGLTKPGLVREAAPPNSGAAPVTNTAPKAAGAQDGLTKPGLVREAAPPNSGAAPDSKPPIAQTQNGLTKPAAISAAAAPLPRNGLDAVIAKGVSQDAYAKFEAQKKQFAQPPAAAPASADAVRSNPTWTKYGGHYKSADDYYAARERARAHVPPPPLYVVNMAPSYGLYDVVFLDLMLSGRPDYNRWYAANQNDPGVQAWHAEAMRQAETNAELREKLARADQYAADQKAAGVKLDSKLPDDVDPAFAIAPQAALLATAAPSGGLGVFGWLMVVLVIGTIIAAGVYYLIVRLRPKQPKVKYV